MPNPLVSVVLSAYNRPDMLEQALTSVLKQTYPNLEIIVQDDSTDDLCEQVVARVADDRIQYTHNRPSLGTSQNLYAGYRKATGEYFCTLNDDDLYSPDYIETMVAELEKNPESSLGFSDHWLIDQHGEILQTKTEENTRTWRRDALREGPLPEALRIGILDKSVPGMFAVYRRKFMDLEDFPDEISSGYDYWMVYLAVRDSRPAYYSAKRLTSYRDHPGSQTSSFDDPRQKLRSVAYDLFICQRFLADPRLQSIHGPLTKRLAETYNAAGFAYLKLNERGAAMREFRLSLKTQPGLRGLIGLALCAAPGTLIEKLARR